MKHQSCNVTLTAVAGETNSQCGGEEQQKKEKNKKIKSSSQFKGEL